jgi:hypothetical protein
MRKLIAFTMTGVLAMGLGIGIVGCSEESGSKVVETNRAPDGSQTKTTVEKKVETSGSNPPPPANP